MNLNNYVAGISYVKFYLLIFLIAVVFGAFSNMTKTRKKAYVLCTFAIFFVVMAFRSYNMGNDTDDYVIMFKVIARASSLAEYIDGSGIESGYITFNWIISRVFGDERALFIIHSAIINISLGRFIYKNVERPGMFCCLYVGLTQFDFMLSAMRQGLAIAILLFAFDKLVDKKRLWFILLCLLATTFHNSAWIMLLLYPFIGRKNEENVNNRKFYIVIFIATVFFGLFFNSVISRILVIFPRYNYYVGSEYFDGEPRLAVFLKMIAFMLLYLIPKLISKSDVKRKELYLWGDRLSVMNIAVVIIAHNATALMRLSPIFNLYTTMHYANDFDRISGSDKKIIFLLSVIAVFIYGLVIIIMKTPEWQTTYPISLQF